MKRGSGGACFSSDQKQLPRQSQMLDAQEDDEAAATMLGLLQMNEDDVVGSKPDLLNYGSACQFIAARLLYRPICLLPFRIVACLLSKMHQISLYPDHGRTTAVGYR